MIIDCHTHCYSPEVAAQPRQWAEARGEHHWADLVAPTHRKSIQDWAEPEKFLAAMDAAGVDRAVLLGWYWEHESTCRWHNQVIAEWVRQAPERFIGFAAILPNQNVIDQLEYAHSLGLSGVGELHPGVQSFDSQNQHWQALAHWCAAHNWPVNCHATSEVGRDHPSAVATPLRDYLKMAQDQPGLKLILAHWGGGLPLLAEPGTFHLAGSGKSDAFRRSTTAQKRAEALTHTGHASHSRPDELPLLAEQTLPENLYFDCAASPLLYPVPPWREVIDTVGLRRVLFGSDYPLRVYPRQQQSAEMTTFLDNIRQLPALTEAELAAVLGGNFAHLLNCGS